MTTPTTTSYDSSALVTLNLQDRGWHAVQVVLAQNVPHVIATPALTETVVRARENGNRSTPEQLQNFLLSYGIDVVDVTAEDALRAARLSATSRSYPGTAARVRS